MSNPYLGEIRMFAGNFAPQGFELCDGRLLPISEHDALYALLGTTYGGNGETTFGLPDLRGRLPVHQGTGTGLSPRTLGQAYGTEQVTVTTAQLPAHHHAMTAATAATSTSPVGALPGVPVGGAAYAEPSAAAHTLHAATVTSAGGTQPHDNRMPTLAITFIIATAGLFPTQS
ncbi:phage tail protein [Nocardioides abyssi]|uniref:Tail fiber protein n=1 Tax=Nocardioides abyssi TaxID=3058370 RepID=A0ABT8EZT1_9ACTN|nr:tail fiber protein [Nocardioides abyssi]MDN4163326.1 tail fiber protein [Nocardioides abyssi]